jgi:large subunit ribosomal protein L10
VSKAIKQMQMDALKQTFGGVRDLAVLNIVGLNATSDNRLRNALRKKQIRLLQVKNSLARLVFKDLGIDIGADSPLWAGNTVFAWGGTSVAGLIRGIDDELDNPRTAALYRDKVKRKGAVAEGQTITWDVGKKMPTREEALAAVLAAVLGPASQIAGCLTGPAAQVASQIKTISEKKEEVAPAATA